MSAREELATVLERAYDLNEGMATFELLAHAILAAGWRPPARAITTVAELDALPTLSVVTRNRVPYTKNGTGWHIAGVTDPYSADSLLLNDNATLIYNPEWTHE